MSQELVNREQWIADQKSIGAMELALERICDRKWTREESISEARKALGLVRKFRQEANQNNDTSDVAS